MTMAESPGSLLLLTRHPSASPGTVGRSPHALPPCRGLDAVLAGLPPHDQRWLLMLRLVEANPDLPPGVAYAAAGSILTAVAKGDMVLAEELLQEAMAHEGDRL